MSPGVLLKRVARQQDRFRSVNILVLPQRCMIRVVTPALFVVCVTQVQITAQVNDGVIIAATPMPAVPALRIAENSGRKWRPKQCVESKPLSVIGERFWVVATCAVCWRT